MKDNKTVDAKSGGDAMKSAGSGYDIAFVAVKAYDAVWATTLIRQYLSVSGCVGPASLHLPRHCADRCAIR